MVDFDKTAKQSYKECESEISFSDLSSPQLILAKKLPKIVP